MTNASNRRTRPSPHLRPRHRRPQPAAGRRAPRPALGPGRARVRRPHRDPGAPPARGRGRRAGRRRALSVQHIEAGLFAVAVPFTDLIDYRLEVSYPGGDAGSSHRRRPLPLPAHARRDRPASVRRGPPRAAVGDPRRAPAQLHHPRRRRRRRVVRRVGAERQGRQPDRRVQPLGRQRGADAGARLDRGLGAVLARTSRPTACTSSGCTAPTASVTDRADPMAFATEVPPQTASRVTTSDYTWATTTGWPAAR